MNDGFDSSAIRLVGDPLQWARAHSSMFFSDGVSREALVAGLVDVATVLGATGVETISLGDWSIVASPEDWFGMAKFPIPEDFAFQALAPCPELGRNAPRPEFALAAFARDIIVRSPSGTKIVAGEVSAADPALLLVSQSQTWQRAIAFRGLRPKPAG